ncbi:hypothetical protein [Deinococcus cellulosilyticus]|uniref:Uncharacterized protein n=1 Tax=Deinococcus cellulosilyticus (strain DSM 18568 / NBRC 106333 / KACC 11606 / 5516J-15) TaxID=1223518 RepID=A0A511NBG7_DEIC1|nr:hypothetical protein [Deinococcus cellulosilyticus]GEM50175.1 hypothetical protein DC3_58100 [Deinococcus cellulosilyticus NBRC 106333 = KACC 11606]
MISLPTHHVYSVPQEVAQKCCTLADLHQPFGPRFQSFSRFELLRVARQVFDCLPPGEDLITEEALVECIMDCAARERSHQLFMLQLSGSVVQGLVLLVSNIRLAELHQALSAALLQITV